MKRILFLCVSCVALSGCASSANLNSTLNTLAVNYAHCDRTVNYSATIGSLNPASGAQIQGTVHCPPSAPTDVVLPSEPPQ